MKKLIIYVLLALPVSLCAQIGIKAGLNFANVTKAASINNSSRTGFHAGLFLAPPTQGIMGFRTEFIFSRQGYDYKSNTNTGNVNLDYIMLPQLMCINITKFFQIQLGGQMAYLISAKADSATNGSNGGSGNQIMDLYNRFDFGYGGGIEIHPVSGLIIGARFNVSLGDLYKDISSASAGTMPSFIPKVDVKTMYSRCLPAGGLGNSPIRKRTKKMTTKILFYEKDHRDDRCNMYRLFPVCPNIPRSRI